MKNHLLSLAILLFINNISAQEVLKNCFIPIHDLGADCKNPASINKIIVDNTNQNIKFYAWTNILGGYDITFKKNSEEVQPKTNKEKFGKLLKKLDAINTGNEEGTAAGLAIIRTFSFADLNLLPNISEDKDGVKYYGKLRQDEDPITFLPFSNLEYNYIYSGVYNKNREYKFNKSTQEICGFNSRWLVKSNPPTIPMADFFVKYPEFDITKRKESYTYLAARGEGLLGTKNMKYLIERRNDYMELNPMNALMRGKSKIDTLNLNEVNEKVGDCFSTHSEIDLDKDNTFAILRGSTKDDKWGSYHSYKIMKYNKEGKVLHYQHLKLEYLKDVSFFNFSYDKKGNKSGLVLILSDFTMIGGKSLRDPKDNNNILYYFDLDGNEKFHYNFEHGEKLRSFNAMFIQSDGDNLKIWNQNVEKILKPYTELINFDTKGKVSYVKYSNDGAFEFDHVALNSSSKLFNLRVLEDGNFMLTNQNVIEKNVQEGAFTRVVRTYDKMYIAILTPELDVVNTSAFTMGGSTPAEMDYLGTIDGKYKFMLYSKERNHLVALGKTNTFVSYPRPNVEHNIRVPVGTLDRNYHIDKENRKIYCIYENMYSTAQGYLVVMGY